VIAHLYIHVPFCAAKCHYCAFYSRPGTTTQMRAYISALQTELDHYTDQLALQTVFIGGGTPSLLPLELWQQLSLPRPSTEFTIECNPATVDAAKTAHWRRLGVNRLSLGAQSFDDTLLRLLGRIHTARQAVDTYRLLRDNGFNNLNLDLMFGLPGQTLEQWRQTLEKTVSLQPEHISTYCLTLEEDTEFYRRGHFQPDDEQNVAHYELAIQLLTTAGYRHYEISNFAKPGHECLHNLAYWQGKDYLGLGPGACSTIGMRRWQNVANTDRYIAAPGAIEFEETLTPELRQAERVAFGLRMTDGVPAELVLGRWDAEVERLLADGLVQWRDNRLQLTRRGLLFADEVAAAFV